MTTIGDDGVDVEATGVTTFFYNQKTTSSPTASKATEKPKKANWDAVSSRFLITPSPTSVTSLLGVLPDQDEIKNEATLAANHNQTENEASLSAWSYSLEELRKLQDTAPIKFKLLDFTSCDDEWLLQLFPLRAGLKANCKLSPPPSWRVNAKLIRQ